MNETYSEVYLKRESAGWRLTEYSEDFLSLTGFTPQTLPECCHNFFEPLLSPDDLPSWEQLSNLPEGSHPIFPWVFSLTEATGTSSLPVLLQVARSEGDSLHLLVHSATFLGEQLSRMERRIRSLEESVPSGLCQVLLDESFTIIWHNQQFLDLLGYTKEQFFHELGGKGIAYVYPEDLNLISEQLHQAQASGSRYFTVEMRVKRRDGVIRYLLTSLSFTDERFHGIPVLYSMGIDVTDQKRVAQFERDSNWLHMAMEQSSTYILEYDVAASRLLGAEGLIKYFHLQDGVERVPETLVESGMVSPCSEGLLCSLFEQIAQGIDRTEGTICLKNPTGTGDLWLLMRLTAVSSEEGRTRKALVLMEDVTERRRIDLRFLEEEKRRAAMTYDMDFSFQLDLTNEKILTANRPRFSYFNFERSDSSREFLRTIAALRIHEEDRGEYLRQFCTEHLLERFAQGQTDVTLEFRADDYQQGYRWYRGVANIIREPTQGHVYAYLYTKDIDDDKRLELDLRRRAEYDILTGLLNRYTVELKCDQALATQSAAVLYLLDLDNFKALNDVFGHIRGDELLQQVSQQMTALFDKSALLGRLGGDELVIFLPGPVTPEQAQETAQRICQTIQGLRESEGLVTVSVGLCLAPRDGTTFSQLYCCADEALSQAKKAGKNCWHIHEKTEGATLRPFQGLPPLNWEWLLDESSDIIYVSDFYNYDLLYMNRGAKNTFSVIGDSYLGKKCYKLLQGKDQPCEFCNNHLLCREQFYCWEFRNSNLGCSLMLRDRIVDWHGVPARIEFATDISSIARRNQVLEDQVVMDNTIISCLRILNSAKSLEDSAEPMLKALTEFYGADRALIFDYLPQEDMIYPRFEWFNPGLRSCMNVLGSCGVRPSILLHDCFQCRKDYFYEQGDSTDGASHFHQLLYDNGVVRQRGVPFYINGKPAGLLLLDNPTLYRDEMTVLETLSYFISEELTRSRLSERLTYLSYHDSLTGLWNRNRYVEYLETMCNTEELRTLGVAVADLNALKDINKLRGHTRGDIVVRRTAELLCTCFPGAQVFRLSGDEFVIHSENLTRLDFLEQVKQVEEREGELDAHGISLGYAWTDQEIDCSNLTLQATEIMLMRKREYYNHVKDGNSMGKLGNSRLQELLECFRAGKFEMYLQPKANCNGFCLNGAEALVRFRYSKDVVISPDRFIPILEQEHNIKYVDLFIFEEVCKLLNRWQKEGRDLLPISLNFSRQTLLEPDLLKTILSLSARYQVPKDCIEVEITESLGEYNSSTIAEIGAGIKSAGFRLALDDFGSHYTNMAMLSAVPADVLKLDRSMVRDVMSSRPNQLVLKSVLSLCKELNISSIAEGVETVQQFELLCSLKCDSIQGYLFGHPTTVEEFERRYLLKTP